MELQKLAEKLHLQDHAASENSNVMERADHDMGQVLEALGKLGGKPIETLTAAEARQQPTPTDAVKAILREKGKDPAKLSAESGVTTRDLTYPGAAGALPVRLYMPEQKSDKELPVIVYFHGGGWVIADIDVYDAGPRALAKKAKAIVASFEYRQAPENKFPAAHEDAFAAYKWALDNAASWGGDNKTVAVAGESAGGNLAANVAIMARDKGIQAPAHMALIYPVAGNDMNTDSYQENANAKPLNKPMMEWFVKQVVNTPADTQNPMINLVAAKLSNLPPATIITAEIDPLMSEGKLLAEKLEKAGNDVTYKNYEGVTHEFFGMGAVVSKSADAQDFVAKELKNSFEAEEK